MCSTGECINIDYDDSQCANVCKCCVGISDQGDQAKCRSACRKCRNFGTVWEPRRPMRPLPIDYMYNDAPGYATNGAFLKEGFMDTSKLGKLFDIQCIAKNAIYGAVLTVVLYYVTKRKMDFNEVLSVSLVAALVKCVLNAL